MRMLRFFLCAALLAVVLACDAASGIRVMTFNVRYDNAADTGAVSWTTRRGDVVRMVIDEMPDIVGMQEVLANQYDDLRRLLPQYAAIGCGRDDGRRAGEYEPVMWRRDRFECVDSGHFWLSETPDVAGSLGWDGACVRMASWAVLRNLQRGDTILALNTHLDHVGPEARRQSALLLLGRLSRLGDGRYPIVATGDFNSVPSDEPIRILTDSARLFDSRKVASTIEGPDWTFHNFGRIAPEERTRIDYIFAGQGVDVERLRVIDNSDHPSSDHCAVVAEISVR